MQLSSPPSIAEGETPKPRPKLTNEGTLQASNAKRTTQMSDIRNFLGKLRRTPFVRSSEKAPSGLPQDCHQARDVAVRGPSGAASGNRKRRQHEKVPRPSLVLIGAYDSRRAWRGSATRIRLYLDGYVTRYAQPCISIQYHNVWGRTRGVQVRRNHPRALGGWCLFAILDANFAEFTFYALG